MNIYTHTDQPRILLSFLKISGNVDILLGLKTVCFVLTCISSQLDLRATQLTFRLLSFLVVSFPHLMDIFSMDCVPDIIKDEWSRPVPLRSLQMAGEEPQTFAAMQHCGHAHGELERELAT